MQRAKLAPPLRPCPWTLEDTLIFIRLRSGAYTKLRWQAQPYRAAYYRTLNL